MKKGLTQQIFDSQNPSPTLALQNMPHYDIKSSKELTEENNYNYQEQESRYKTQTGRYKPNRGINYSI